MLKVYDEYSSYGPDQYYKQFFSSYYNPHELKILKLLDNIIYQYLQNCETVLDFACGDGLISKYINSKNIDIIVKGSDPYFNNEYCNYNFSFDDIICGKMKKKFDIIICCYAYHLLDFKKRYDFLTQLSFTTKKFVIISPSKKITINHPLWKVLENIRIDKITIIIVKVKKFK